MNILRFLSVLSLAALIHITAFSQSYNSQDGKIYAAGYGAHNSTTLQAIITRIGANNVTLVVNGGVWTITDSLTFPANITVEIPVDSYLNIATTKTVTINGAFDAGGYSIRSNDGIINGAAKFLYRWDEWGPSNRVMFTSSGLIGQTWNLDETLAQGNNAGMQQATNFSRIQAVTGDFHTVTASNILGSLTGNVTGDVYGTLYGTVSLASSTNDMALSYNGYPYVAITTNQATIALFNDAATITMATLTNLLDGDFTTCTQTQRLNEGGINITFDLGKHYVGYLMGQVQAKADTGYNMVGLTYSSLSTSEQSVYRTLVNYGGQMATYSVYGTAYVTNTIVIPFSGRYVGLSSYVHLGDDGYTCFREFRVYGTTNNYRSFTGTP